MNKEKIQKIEILQKQGEYYLGLFRSRREFEWKITLGFWAMLVASATVINDIAESGLILFMLGLFFVLFWIKGIWVANFNDKTKAFYCLSQIEKFLLSKKHSIEKMPDILTFKNPKWWFGFLLDWSALFQISFTVLVLFALYKISLSN